MGFTHYFSHTAVSQDTWDKIIDDAIKLWRALPEDIVLTGCSRYGKDPHFGKDEIWFNGDESKDLDHETFILYRDGVPEKEHYPEDLQGFIFCKTARKPYDLMVCACLLVYKYHSSDTMRLSSNGDSDDWRDAEEFVKDVLGYDVKYRRDENEL